MKLRITAIALLLAIMSVFVVTPKSTNAASSGLSLSGLSIPFSTATGSGTITSISNLTFTTVNGVLGVTGTAAGTFTQTGSTTAQNFTSPFTAAVTNLTTSGAKCQILHLTLGPINLDLLGLQVSTNQIVLDISAQPGSGQLLGNLLCSVANLLNQPSALATLLNSLLGQLQLVGAV